MKRGQLLQGQVDKKEMEGRGSDSTRTGRQEGAGGQGVGFDKDR